MKEISKIVFFVFALSFSGPTFSEDSVAKPEHNAHTHKSHKHGKKNCAHKSEKHGDHTDYEHDGHHHKAHAGHYDECDGPENDAKSAE
jgi:hypothetical protein